MQTDGIGESPAKSRGWPYCSLVGGKCLAYDVSAVLGSNILQSLLAFVMTAEDGARLTLQKNKDGFTLQTTGAVQRPVEGPIGIKEVRLLRSRLSLLTEMSD